MATLLNRTVDGENALEKLKGIAAKARQRANATEAMAKHSKEALSKAEVDLAAPRADLALEKQRRKVEVKEAKRAGQCGEEGQGGRSDLQGLQRFCHQDGLSHGRFLQVIRVLCHLMGIRSRGLRESL